MSNPYEDYDPDFDYESTTREEWEAANPEDYESFEDICRASDEEFFGDPDYEEPDDLYDEDPEYCPLNG